MTLIQVDTRVRVAGGVMALLVSAAGLSGNRAAGATPTQDFFQDGLRPRPCRVNAVLQDTARQRITLDGDWDFATDPKDVGENERWYLPETDYPGRLRVPGSWNAQGAGGEGELPWFWGGPMRVPGSYSGLAWYRRQVSIPGEWQGRIVWLNVGGAMPNVRIWLNGDFVGARFSDGLSFGYEVTRYIRPGEKNTIAIAIDNRLEMVAMSRHLNVWGSWGGIFKTVVLEAAGPIHVKDIFIIPSIDPRRATARIKLRNASEAARPAELRIEARPAGNGKVYRATRKLTLNPGENDAEIRLDMPDAKLWTLEKPFLYHFSAKLLVDGRVVDEWKERFGLRTLEVNGSRAMLNGKPLFINGTPYDGYFPLSLTPPITRDEYKRIFRTIKSHGFNYLRVIWLPPLECVEAADEVGILLQIELEEVGGQFLTKGRDDFMAVRDGISEQMLLEIAYEYRNHPAFATYDMANERMKGEEYTFRLYDLIKTIDDTRWAIDSDGSEGPPRRTSDLWLGFSEFWAYDDPNPKVDGARDVYNKKPVVHHEFLNIPCLPHLEDKEKYTGAIRRPASLAQLERWLRERNLYDLYPSLRQSSYHIQRIYSKAGIEAVRRDRGPQGYCWFENINVDQVNIWSGVMTSFHEPKGWPPEELRRINGQSVLLMRQVGAPYYKQGDITPGGSVTHYYGEPVKISFMVSHYGEPIRDAGLSWKLVSGGKCIQSGWIGDLEIRQHTVSDLGQIEMQAPIAAEARKYVLSAELRSPNRALENSWEFWFFPKGRSLGPSPLPVVVSGGASEVVRARYPFVRSWKLGAGPEALLITDSYRDALGHLKRGGRVLLLSLENLPLEHQRPGFYPGWWVNTPGRSLGIVLARHDAFGDFPHSGVADWQISRLIDGAVTAPPDAFTAARSVEPLAYGLTLIYAGDASNSVKEPRLLMHLFQTRVGAGRLLACGFNLLQDLPEAEYMLGQLIRYALSDRFEPGAQCNWPGTERASDVSGFGVRATPGGFAGSRSRNILSNKPEGRAEEWL